MATHQDLILLTAPPASGKTYWIRSFYEALSGQKLLVVSPLRALAEECKKAWDNQIVVVTPEEWLKERIPYDIVIFDEFHLYCYWGDSFRPQMWEAFYELTSYAGLSVLLTGTLSDETLSTVTTFDSHFDSMEWLDFGNQKLKFQPTTYLKLPTLKLLKDVMSVDSGEGVSLVFCAYREEVLALQKWLENLGFVVWTCLGGEANAFSIRLSEQTKPQFIVATTVLSHGVNLPEISKIYFTYKVENLDFWIQMVARGGRRGERFAVYSLEHPTGLDWSSFRNSVSIIWMMLKVKILKILPELRDSFLSNPV